ncbi:hypothetical protein CALCODRAFT_500186 [Calocera cornea HHB12733]|uniref:C4-dicarboxylate transporter/malic acid transport protein n=1 Tax=Calocera cornea HHB12733 TaxID=1353952 RepID=A0A165E5X3_9BASI|nr:hypothetical protein CALCODRAFT_500186 [Calocera cornea HHB12733]
MSTYRTPTSTATLVHPPRAHLSPAISRQSAAAQPSLLSQPSEMPLSMLSGNSKGDSTGKHRRKNFIERIRHFTPSWFAVTMGTGVLPVVFHQLPYGLSEHLFWPCVGLLGLNTVLLFCFTIATLLRYILFPGIFKLMLLHPQQSLFLGTIPMGFATAINAATSLLVETKGWGGEGLIDFLWGMYWFDVVLSAVVCVGMLHVVSTKHPLTLDGITATILLPFVPPIVAAALGSQLGTAMAETHPGRAQLTLFVSYTSLGLGLPTAMLMLCIYTVRLILHGAPPRGALTSVVLPLGPLGQGGLAFVSLGELAQKIIIPQDRETSTIPTNSVFGVGVMGDFAFVYGVVSACLMWGFGMLWLCLALETLAEALFKGQGPKFGMPWWGLTFPIGVYTLLTLSLSVALAPAPISFFLEAFGTALAAVLTLIWVYVGTRTVILGIEGSMFDAPCLQNLGELPVLAADGPGQEEEEIEMEARRLRTGSARTALDGDSMMAGT